MPELSIIGKSVARVDALEKVTGRAKYCDDFKMPGMLYAKVLRSPYPHARILSIDTSKAWKLPGVRTVVTGKDAPNVRIGQLVWDEYVLPRDGIVRYIGQPVAAVAADTMEIAEESLDLIQVEYEELPAIFDVEEAFRPNPPVVIHPDLSTYFVAGDVLQWHRDPARPNVCQTFKIRNGDVDKGFREADLIIENSFTTSRIQHCPMERHRASAWWEADGSLVVTVSTNVPGGFKPQLCALFNLPTSRVRIITPFVGGAFGGGTASLSGPLVALLALKSGRPVGLRLTREEIFVVGRHRWNVICQIKDGVRRDGTLIAREMKIIADLGAHSAVGALLVKNCAFGAVGSYRIPNLKFDSYGVYTNAPLTGPFRGFGVTEIIWPIEQQMDMIAEKLGINPVELRRKNLLKEGEPDVLGQETIAIGAEQCLERVKEWIRWGKKSEKGEGPWRKGKGIALGNKYTMAGWTSVAIVKVHPDEMIEVRHGSAEVGQGLNTVVAEIAAEEFHVPIDHVKVVYGDTGSCPRDYGAVSSRCTFHVGNAVRRACQDAKRQMLDIASGSLGVNPEDMDIKKGRMCVTGFPGKGLKFSELFNYEGVALKGGEILGKASFVAPIILEDSETGRSEKMVAYYAHGAHAVEVAVNVDTGEVKVLRIVGAFDMGTPINPKMCEGQIEGGIYMGMASALYEEIVLEKGAVVNPSFMDYKIPTATEMPSLENMVALLQPCPHRDGPFGAKGLGEGVLLSVAPAIANAVYDAVGVRIKELPISREKVLTALNRGKKR